MGFSNIKLGLGHTYGWEAGIFQKMEFLASTVSNVFFFFYFPLPDTYLNIRLDERTYHKNQS